MHDGRRGSEREHNVMCYVPEIGTPGERVEANQHEVDRVFRRADKAKGIISKELTVGCKTVHTAFFVIDMKERYNVLLGRDWIHANGCVPSTLHQCLIQWVGNQVEVVEADNILCVTVAESQGCAWGRMRCLECG
jgi:hypothetical protein